MIIKRLMFLLILLVPINTLVPKSKETLSEVIKKEITFEEAMKSAFNNVVTVSKVTEPTVTVSSDKLDVNKDVLTFQLEGQSQNLVFTKIKDFQEISVGQCLVRFKDCAFYEENLAKWEKSGCSIHPIKDSYQVVDLDLKQESALTIYWYGTKYSELIESHSSLSFKWERYNEWFLKVDKERAWYQGNCGLIQAQVKNWEESFQEKVAAQLPKKEEVKEKPLLKVGDCVASVSECSLVEDKEEWETSCHPYSKVYKIKKVGKRSYLAMTWYGYEDDHFDLLFTEETFRFWQLDRQDDNQSGFNYHKVSCKKMKKQYPQGNYSKIFQRNNKKSRGISSK